MTSSSSEEWVVSVTVQPGELTDAASTLVNGGFFVEAHGDGTIDVRTGPSDPAGPDEAVLEQQVRDLLDATGVRYSILGGGSDGTHYR